MWFNPLMVWLLRSPLHSAISRSVLLMTVVGHKSGKSISTPTNYVRDGNTVWVISWRARRWWRNLRGGANVQVLLAGEDLNGLGQVVEEDHAVAKSLFDFYRRIPQQAKYVKIGLDPNGLPIAADCQRAAEQMVVIRVDLL